MYIGSCHVEEPYITVGAVSTVFYFAWFLILIPMIGLVENTLLDIATESSSSNPLYQITAPSLSRTSVLNIKRRFGTACFSKGRSPSVLEATRAINEAVAAYDPSTQIGTPEEFCLVANGFFQAEGFVGILF